MKRYAVTVLSTAYLDMASAIMTLNEYSEPAAARFVDTLEAKLGDLEFVPEMYPVYDDFPIYRKLVIMDYLVFYTVDHSAQTVDVHRIIYGKRDISKQL